MNELDGNGAAGLLREIFGKEMTTAAATCASCGTVALIGESDLYPGGPGTVIRCRTCTSVLIVITRIRDMHCVDLMGMRELDALSPDGGGELASQGAQIRAGVREYLGGYRQAALDQRFRRPHVTRCVHPGDGTQLSLSLPEGQETIGPGAGLHHHGVLP